MAMMMVNRWVRSRMVGGSCRVSSCKMLHLVTRLVASLRLRYLPSGQLHMGIPHPFPVQLFLGPQQHLQAHSQLALGGFSMLSPQDSSIKLTGHLLPMTRGQQVCKRTAGWIIKSQESKSPLQFLQHRTARSKLMQAAQWGISAYLSSSPLSARCSAANCRASSTFCSLISSIK